MKCFVQQLTFYMCQLLFYPGESFTGYLGISNIWHLLTFYVTKRAGNTVQLEFSNILFWLYSLGSLLSWQVILAF